MGQTLTCAHLDAGTVYMTVMEAIQRCVMMETHKEEMVAIVVAK